MSRLAGALLVAGLAPFIALHEAPDARQAPASPQEAAARATELLAADLYVDAIDLAAEALERWPEAAALHALMGDALYRRGDFDEAERHYRRAADLDPMEAAARFGVGRILRTLGRYAEAAEWFHRAATLAPDRPKYLRVLANHLARREDSIGMLRRYLELARSRPGQEDEAIVRNVEAWLALLESMGEAPLSELAKGEPCSLSMQVFKGQAYVRLDVAGLRKQKFVFDTGATGLTISPRIAARAKLVPIKPYTMAGTGSKRLETGQLVLVPEIAVGEGIVMRNVPAALREPSGSEEGLIGPSFFSPFDITVEMKAGRLIFEKPAEGARPGREEPFRNVGGEIFITARVDGVPFNAMLDTGSAATVIGRTTVGRVPGMQALPGQWAAALGSPSVSGIGGALADRRIILRGTLSFAGRDYPAGGLPSGDLSGFSRSLESEVYVILGAPHLDDAPFTISYRRMSVTFAPVR